VRPRTAGAGTLRAVDCIVLLVPVAIVLQAIPLPSQMVSLLSPHGVNVRQDLALTALTPSWMSVSIDATSTLWSAAIAIGTVAVFFAARAIVAEGGLRQTVRGTSALGFAFSVLALAQAASAGRFIYWRFRTEYEGPLPFGPFVNRNHFATWVIMAAPLCFGYLIARAARAETAAAPFVSTRTRLARVADGRMIWLATAGAMMIAALIVSMSRSGILSLSVAAVVLVVARRAGHKVRRAWWALGVLAVVVGLALARVDISALAGRFSESGTGVRDRVRIWTDTLPIVRDFWLTGTGMGTYQTAMLSYQRADRTLQFNQAHNHYLQVAAEAGIIGFALLTVLIAALARTIWRRLASDATGAHSIRAGAACGLLAVALQSLWETGLVMPANAALAAVLAAIVSYER
jgi:putative inorganic carbon (HCO3(-)) transporter